MLKVSNNDGRRYGEVYFHFIFLPFYYYEFIKGIGIEINLFRCWSVERFMGNGCFEEIGRHLIAKRKENSKCLFLNSQTFVRKSLKNKNDTVPTTYDSLQAL